MKKKHFAVLTFALCFSLLSTACGTSKNSTESTQTQKGLVLTVSSTADFVDQATTLQELIDSSDIVAKVNVQKVDSCVYKGTDSVVTSITPEILEIYKGTYNGETFDMYGGYISCAEYQNAPIFQENDDALPFDTSSYSESEINNAQLYWDWCNVYIPSAGDTLLYFGKVSDNNNFFLTNAYQGLFHLEDGNWTNQALITGSQTQQEMLVTDLLNISGSSAVESPQTGISKTIDAITYTYPGSDYDTMISIPESALTEAIQKNISDAE